jgi:hypothetical protein
MGIGDVSALTPAVFSALATSFQQTVAVLI